MKELKETIDSFFTCLLFAAFFAGALILHGCTYRKIVVSCPGKGGTVTYTDTKSENEAFDLSPSTNVTGQGGVNDSKSIKKSPKQEITPEGDK